eukprot:6896_1
MQRLIASKNYIFTSTQRSQMNYIPTLSVKSYEKFDNKLAQHKIRSIHIVSAYVQPHQNTLKRTIPEDIINVILLFYHIDHVQQLLNGQSILDDIDNTNDIKQISITKLKLCSHRFIFTKQSLVDLEYKKAIEIKKQYLTEIIETFSKESYINYEEYDIKQFLTTIGMNIFRPLPSWHAIYIDNISVNDLGCDVYIEEPSFTDGSWVHLQLIYELFLRIMISSPKINIKLLQKCINKKFIENVINLFASENQQERDYLKSILHRMYARFMRMRRAIRQLMANYVLHALYEEHVYVHTYEQDLNGPIPENTQKCYRILNVNGIAELFDIYHASLNGFSVPLKEEHKNFLMKVIIPLHKYENINLFFQQLNSCCIGFVSKDMKLGRVILYALMKYWPYKSVEKQLLFIGEIEDIIGLMINHNSGFKWSDNKHICLLVIDRLIKCSYCEHYQIAEKALYALMQDIFKSVMDFDKNTVWPILIYGLLDAPNHWNKTVRSTHKQLLNWIKERDSKLFEGIVQKYNFERQNHMI